MDMDMDACPHARACVHEHVHVQTPHTVMPPNAAESVVQMVARAAVAA